MIEKLYVAFADGSDTVMNLALETTFLGSILPGEMLLFLWQATNSVVIGRHQDVNREVNLPVIESEGVNIYRRTSGGRAVYLDLGNLNYTFIARDTDFSIERQTKVIHDAICKLGIPAEIVDRDDIYVDGKKVAGSSYYHLNGASLQQGSILVSCDLSKVVRYMNLSTDTILEEKLDRVKDKVGNLCDTIPSLTVLDVGEEIVRTYTKEYGMDYDFYPMPNPDMLQQKEYLLLSRSWLRGNVFPADYTCEGTFPWGYVRLEFQVEAGEILHAAAWSNSVEPDVFSFITFYMVGTPFHSKDIVARLRDLEKSPERDDVIALITEQNY